MASATGILEAYRLHQDEQTLAGRRYRTLPDAADHHGYAIDEAEVVYWALCSGCSAAHRT